MRFSRIRELAAQVGGRPYQVPAENALPEWIRNLTYDQYRDIRFNPAHALWASEKLPFSVMFFHPGYLYRQPVAMNEFTASHQQRVRLSEVFFNYGPQIQQRGPLPADGGFAGFRIHYPLNRPDYQDELISLLGGCYWRALGKDQAYGLSARGLALNTGVAGVAEEFPVFREFWLSKPDPGDAYVRFYALLDSPSYAGAYSFRVYPGDETRVEVRAVIHARTTVKRLGLAPISSMFWFGENSRRKFDDFRPEVHDSDGLAIRMGTGERIWRPLMNDTGEVGYSFFNMDQCGGFGLLQRDRRMQSYEDKEACYDRRPSLWIEPVSGWGAGQVMLMEIPATNELHDNVVALWEPAVPLLAGQSLEFRYKQYWTVDPDPAKGGGYVVATRTGVHDWEPNRRTVFVEFSGPNLQDPGPQAPEAVIQMLGDANQRAVIDHVAVQQMEPGRWRASFQIAPAKADGKLADIGPLELRCCLKQGEQYLTETWAYRITP